MPPEAPLPPQNLDAEQMVLGACMLAPGAVEVVTDILDGREFYYESHQKIFAAIVNLWSREAAVDGVTVCDELVKMKAKDVDPARVHEIATIVPAASNAGHYANIVRETWLARGLVNAGTEIAQLGYERPGSIEDIIREADAKVIALQDHLERKTSNIFTGKDLAERFRYRLSHPDEFQSTIKPPFRFLENQIIDGQLHVLAAYQGTGKTSALWQFGGSAAEAGNRVGIWTLEMTPEALGDRLITSFGVPSHQVRLGRVDSEYQPRVERALEKLEKWDVEIVNDHVVTPESVRRRQRKRKYDLILIDHLHRLPVKNPAHKRIELEEAVRKLTNVALEFNVPVILLAQLNRGTLHDPFPRPTRVQLRETGMIENEAALIWFIYRKWDGTKFETEAEWITDKNRFGAPGWWRLNFRPSQVRFVEDHQTGGSE